MALPPCTPYVVADSLEVNHWLSADEPHARSLGKWRAPQKRPNRYTCSQDLAIGKCALYRMRYIVGGDLTDARGDFGGLAAQFDHL